MKKFDILLAKVNFEDSNKYKVRPVLCINKIQNGIIARKMTSKSTRNNYPGEYYIQDWREAGLYKPTVVRMSKYVTVPFNNIIKTIGHLTPKDIKEVKQLMYTPYKEAFNPDDELGEYFTNYLMEGIKR